MTHEEIIWLARDARMAEPYHPFNVWGANEEALERFAALVAAEVHKTYSPIGTVAGGATERTFMHPSVKYVLPTGLQLYARIEVREEDKV